MCLSNSSVFGAQMKVVNAFVGSSAQESRKESCVLHDMQQCQSGGIRQKSLCLDRLAIVKRLTGAGDCVDTIRVVEDGSALH